MKLEFLFKNLKPVSANHRLKRTRTGRTYKSKEAINFEAHVSMQTSQQRADIFEFETHYSPYEHILCAHINIYVPKSKLITRKGCVNQKSLDIDNCFKQTIDSVFKCFDKLDDSAICQLSAFKSYSHDNNHHIYFSLIRQDIEALEEYSK